MHDQQSMSHVRWDCQYVELQENLQPGQNALDLEQD